MTTQQPLPTFLIVGAQKSATRWLRANLGLHPQIYTTAEELWFFNNIEGRYSKRGLDWYREQFVGWDGEPFVGESTPGYMMLRHRPKVVARRIDETLPDVRLIAVLRHPVDRAQSALAHHIKRGRVPETTRLYDLVTHNPAETKKRSIIDGGLYAASLEPYFERFGDRFQVLLHDDVSSDPKGTYLRALRHIGAPEDFVPEELAKVRFSNQAVTRRTRKPSAPSVTPDERAELFEYFRDDVDRLEVLLGESLAAWRPEHTGS